MLASRDTNNAKNIHKSILIIIPSILKLFNPFEMGSIVPNAKWIFKFIVI